MALSREDKADVKGAMGKAIANKVSRVTKDSSNKTLAQFQAENRRRAQSGIMGTGLVTKGMEKEYNRLKKGGEITQRVTSKVNKPFKVEALHKKRMDADRDRDD